VTTNLIGNDPGQVKQHYIVDFTPSSVKFYINGTLVATHTTNIPSAAANIMLDFWGQNGTASNIGLFLSNITFAQTLN